MSYIRLQPSLLMITCETALWMVEYSCLVLYSPSGSSLQTFYYGQWKILGIHPPKAFLCLCLSPSPPLLSHPSFSSSPPTPSLAHMLAHARAHTHNHSILWWSLTSQELWKKFYFTIVTILLITITLGQLIWIMALPIFGDVLDIRSNVRHVYIHFT